MARIAHEVLERHHGVDGLVLVGIQTRGLPLAHRISDMIREFEGTTLPVAALDVQPYRDDNLSKPRPQQDTSGYPIAIEGQQVILVDDVLFTGRTARAAMDALTDLGRPRTVQLAVLVDRGHRELPIRADYVGKNIPTASDERVQVRLAEVDGKDEAVILRQEGTIRTAAAQETTTLLRK